MKKIILTLMAIFTLISMCACGPESHTHSYDDGTVTVDAVCGGIKTVKYSCTGCEHTYTKDYTVVHDWKKATCTTPKTCSICNETDGDALGHVYEENVCEDCGFESFVTVTLPDVSENSIHITNYINKEEVTSFKVTAIDYKYDTSNNDAVKLTVYVSGEKVSDETSENVSSTCTLVYKLYDSEGHVVYSGTYTTPYLAVGDSFARKDFSISNLTQGEEYTLVLTDYYTTK